MHWIISIISSILKKFAVYLLETNNNSAPLDLLDICAKSPKYYRIGHL